MDEKKLVLPGEHLLSGEEAEPGENTYVEKDEIFSAAFGETVVSEGAVAIKRKKAPRRPHTGMAVYCLVKKTSPNKAVADCMPVEGAEGPGSTMPITAVLPVTALGKRGYVQDLRDEIKIGDVIKAQISKITKTGIDISIVAPQCGFICVFCPRCRKKMDLKDRIFICNACEWKERRKIPQE